MDKRIKIGFPKCLGIGTALAIMLATTTAHAAAQTNNITSSRIYGSDRYSTAVAISQNGWNNSSYAVIARGDSFPDALCAAPLAKKYNAPILLSEKDRIDSKVLNEIKRLGVSQVFIVGGTGAISESVENQVKGICSVERLYGSDRYETSAKIAEKIGTSNKITLATGNDFADALSIAPIAASEGMPILLTDKEKLPDSVADYITKNKVSKTYIVGGTGAVGSNIENAVLGAERIYGKDRYETNLNVMRSFSKDINFEKLFIAIGGGDNGSEFADALSGAALAAKSSSPIVLTHKAIDASASDYIRSQITPKSEEVALGGEAVVPSKVLDSINLDKKDYNDTTVIGSKDSNNLENITGNLSLNGSNISLNNAKVDGNIYLYGDNITLSNLNVSGTVFVDPGENGTANLNNVNAKNIKIYSGAQNSIHLKDTVADGLFVESKNNSIPVRIETSGNTKFMTTSVTTNAILDAEAGSFGSIEVLAGQSQDKTIELKGTFDKEVKISSASSIKIGASSSVSSLVIDANQGESVKLQGKVNQLTLGSSAKLNLLDGTEITNITVKNGVSQVIDVPATVKIATADSGITFTGDGAKNIKINNPTNPPAGGGGASGGGSAPSGSLPAAVSGYLTTAGGNNISAAVGDNIITISIPRTLTSQFIGGQVTLTEACNVTVQTILGNETRNNVSSIDLGEVIRRVDTNGDGISKESLSLMSGTSVILTDKDGHTKTYTIAISIN